MKSMIKKVLLGILAAPLAVACFDENTFEITISGMESRPLIAQDGSFIEVDLQNSIDKDELVLEVVFTEIEDLVSGEGKGNKKGGPGVLEAAIVPCPYQVLIYTNRVESIRV